MPASIAIPRRQFLALGASAAASAALPATPIACEAAAAPIPNTVMWIVGTPGEADWQPVRALSFDEARRFRAIEEWGECEAEDEPRHRDEHGVCQCDYCSRLAGYEARRQEAWDDKKADDVTDADWFRARMDAHCSRCMDHADPEYGGAIVADQVICEDCMTIADWEQVDPEYAAELRGEMGDDHAR